MSVRYEFIVAVVRATAMLNELESLPDDRWHVQLALDAASRYDVMQKAEGPLGTGTSNWTKQDYRALMEIRVHDDVLAPINHDVAKGYKLLRPRWVPSEEPTPAQFDGSFWKLQL